MLRILIVLPIYLVFVFVLTKTEIYHRFHQAVVSVGFHDWHLLAYGGALAIGLVGAVLIEFAIRPEDFGFGSALRVARMGFIGLLMLGAYQLCSYYALQELSVFVFTVPVMFVCAEIIYELSEYARYRLSRA